VPPLPRLAHRPATDHDDLRRATALMSRAWAAGAPLVAGSPAGIEWWHASSWPDPLEAHLRLWRDEATGEDVAWTWHDDRELEWHVWTGTDARDRLVTRAVLEAVLGEAGGAAVHTWSAEDDAATIADLEALGFRVDELRLSQWQRRVDEGPALPVPGLPDGYGVRSLRGPEDIPARVETHRAAFAPSRLTVEKYERLVTLPHYRYEDDLVVEAPDGSFAAFAMAWWDPDGRVGEFEPVGTHPDHQRRGLARALLRHGLQRFADLGARVVQVYSDASTPASEALYEAVGFERRAFHRRYERPADRAAGEAAAVASTP
jgi:mycothiol synthase